LLPGDTETNINEEQGNFDPDIDPVPEPVEAQEVKPEDVEVLSGKVEITMENLNHLKLLLKKELK